MPVNDNQIPERFAAHSLFLIAGAFMLLLGLYLGYQQYQWALFGTRAEGVVTSLNAGGSHPEITFVTPDGTGVSYPQGGWIFGYEVGQKVTVLYEPKNPAMNATITAPGALYASSILFCSMGAFFMLGTWLNKRQSKPENRHMAGKKI